MRAATYPFTRLKAVGTRTDYVTFEPYGFSTGHPDPVTIQGISTQNTSFLRFMGFNFVGNDSSGYVAGIQIYLGSSNIQFINNDVSGEGIQLQTASHVLLQGNYIHNITRNCALNAPDGGGIFLTGGSASNPPADDLKVLGNTIQGTPQDAINLVHNDTNVLVAGNDASTTLTPQCGDHTDLVQIEGDAKGPFTITNNIFHDGEEFILRNATGLTIENNLIIRVAHWMQLMADPGARVINNTWWGGNGCVDAVHNCTAGSLLIRDYAPGSTWASPPFSYTNHMNGTVIENNIMRTMQDDPTNPAPQSSYHEDFDLLYGPAKNSIGVQGSHTIYGPSFFVSPAAGVFDPAQGNRALDSADSTVSPPTDIFGQGRSDDPFAPNSGSGPIPYVDRGAIEYQAPSAGTTRPGGSANSNGSPLRLHLRRAFKRRSLNRGVFGVRASCSLPCRAVFAGRLYWRGRHAKLTPSFWLRLTTATLTMDKSRLLNLRLAHAPLARLRREARRFHHHALLIIGVSALGPANQSAMKTIRAAVTL